MAIHPEKLAMALLVKNEIDVIERNIRFHADMGVLNFIVMDNGSTDGTLERLKELQSEFNVIIINNPTGMYQQSKWMTQLARTAKAQFGATHVIPNDADEFWVPKCNKNLPEQIEPNAAVQTIHRVNRVLTKQQVSEGRPYWASEYVVDSPILYTGDVQINEEAVSMQLVKISPKVIVRTTGLIKIKGGNHRARHWKFWSTTKNPNITVNHYPIRSYKQFLANVENRSHLLDKPNVKMGPHYRRWVKQLNRDALESEFQRMLITNEQLPTLEQIGIVKKETIIPNLLANVQMPNWP